MNLAVPLRTPHPGLGRRRPSRYRRRVPIYALGELEPDIDAGAFVHPDAVLIGQVVIGAESSIWPGAVLRGDNNELRVGARTSIQDNAVIHTTPEAPTVVGDGCVIGHLVHLEGCTIESGTLIGVGAVVLHRAVVRTGAIVGANSVVLNGTEIPAGALAIGAPVQIRPGKARGAGHHEGCDHLRPQGGALRQGPAAHRLTRGPIDTGACAARGRPPARPPSARQQAMLGLVVTVPASESELAADSLWALGVTAVEERGATALDDDLVELWTSLGDDATAVATAAEGFPARWRWRIVELDDSVLDLWREHARPSWVEADLVVVPAWLPYAAPAGVIELRIEPGATFGLGDHPSTVLALRALRAVLRPGASVLDVGCGSGVLAVAACVLGAGSARGIDVSPAAAAVAGANAGANGVADRATFDTTPLAVVDEGYDVVVANILAPTLTALADDLRRVTAADGVLIVSGLLEAHHEHVLAALAPLQPMARRTRDGWIAITLGW